MSTIVVTTTVMTARLKTTRLTHPITRANGRPFAMAVSHNLVTAIILGAMVKSSAVL
ncbi:hypothetical protein [Aporhodopirellula aestuarii]|uniref:Uncharacterized protein n=1 Tax=Aporhodopirellula aestuarii TaxID=2950107 RepID=A0ABT0U813_9BACT|nr:hypothetical protein [Aporhodopirellula aestuarii]MCM2373021.1 hypothetical protein [Aporhodopirellula aestuarii]